MVAALLWVTISGEAATPSSGTLTTSSGTLAYTAGPFVVPNPTSNIPGNTQPTCDNRTPCDDYNLTVDLTGASAGFINSHLVEVTISWPQAQADFDLYVLKGAGVVKDAATSSDPEIATFEPEPGSNVYKVRVAPFAPAGQSFNATIRFIDRPVQPPPPPPGSGAARFQTFLSPPDVGEDWGEPSIGANWQSGNLMFYGGFSTYALRVRFDDCASPAKVSWTETPLTLAATLRPLGDPILYTDHVTGRTLVGQLEGGTKQCTTDATDDDGATYQPTVGSGVNSGVDHETLGGGPFAPGAPSHSYPNAIYYCAHDDAVANCALSLDGGVTFGPAVPIYTIADCDGLHGHVKVAPDGTAYVPNNGCGGTPIGRAYQGVAASTDNGITWTLKPVSNTSASGEDPSIGIASDGALYFGYADGDGHPKAVVSHDRGQSWSTPVDIGAAFGIKHTVFPVTVAGDPLRAAVGFLGTPSAGDPNDANTFTGIWHMYVATTYDGGNSWTTVDATPDDPVQIGSVCRAGTTCGDDRNLLDFNDATIDKEGRVIVGYSDGCVAPACTTATAASDSPPYDTSRSKKAVITRQSGGKRMFALYDPNPAEPTAPAAPLVDGAFRTPTQDVHVQWAEPDNGGSALTSYKVYRKDGTGGAYALLATVDPDRTTYDDSTANGSNVQYFYKVTAVNAVGEGTNCGDVAVILPPDGGDPCRLPGVGILSDQAGDLIVPTGVSTNPAWDVRSLSLAEPFSFAPNKVVFTLKVDSLATVPENTVWPVEFDAPDGHRYVAQMSTVPPATPTAPVFQYGQTDAATLATADAASNFSVDGTITIVVPTSGLGSPTPGQNLSGFLTRIAFDLNAVGTITPDNMPDNLAPTGSYTLKGNAFCEPNTAPVADLSATPTSGLAPLAVNLNGSGSSDPNPGDTIASYTFEFGDGTPPVTQSTATISHTYNAVGSYRPRLTVTDSRGKVSSNAPFVDITVRELTTSSTQWGLGSLGHIPVPEDYDGDGLTDFAVWQPSDGTWYLLPNADRNVQTHQWGANGDKPVPADYDGDGKADLAVFRPSDGNWYILRSSTNSFFAQPWGLSTDKPVPGDYDGDGKTDEAMFRPSDGTWYILQSSNNTLRAQQWGLSDDITVPGDYDGDGKTDIAVWRPSNGSWYIFKSTTNSLSAFEWGASGDVPVAADYDGDGKTDVAVIRPSDNVWYILRSASGTAFNVTWGASSDVPVPGNYDGTGGTDVAVWRPSDGYWYMLLGF